MKKILLLFFTLGCFVASAQQNDDLLKACAIGQSKSKTEFLP